VPCTGIKLLTYSTGEEKHLEALLGVVLQVELETEGD